MGNSRDYKLVTLIGGLVGLLIQPIIANLVVSPSIILRLGTLFGFLILAPLALWTAAFLGKFVPVLYQFAKFAAVGALNTMIDFGVFNLEVLFSGISKGVAASGFKAVSFLFATTNSFFWNKYWTFGVKEKATSGEAAKFYLVAFLGWSVNVSIFSFVVNIMGAPHGVSDALWANFGVLCGVAGAFLIDFLGFKYIVFKKA